MAVSDQGLLEVEADHFFWQNCDLAQALGKINSSSPAALAAAFEYLIAPATFSDANGNPTSLFQTLSVSRQISAILSIREAPSKFPLGAAAALQQLVGDDKNEENVSFLPIIRDLVGSGRPPSCPEFLFTSNPAFLWAPELCTVEEANIRKKNQAAALLKQEAAATGPQAMEADAPNKSKNADGGIDAKLVEAQACIRAELTNNTITTTTTTLSPACIAALDIVLNAAAAIGFRQHSSTDNSTDPLLATGLRNQLPDEIVLLIITATVSPSSSFSRCTTVARTVLLPAVVALDAPPTQSLTAAAQHLGKSNPKALIEHCWIPFLVSGGGSGGNNSSTSGNISKYHAEFILRSIKQGAIASDLLYLLIDAIGQIVQYWNDHVIALLQTVLDTRPVVPLPTTPTVTSLAAALLQAGRNSNFKGSIKLAKVVLTFVKGYGKQFEAETVEQCRSAAQSIGTFMMKSTLSALDIVSR